MHTISSLFANVLALVILSGCSLSTVTTLPAPLSNIRDPLNAGGFGPDLVVIPAGKFIMGTPETEPERFDFESPRHAVIIAKPFAIGKYELSFAQYDRFVKGTGYTRPSDKGWGQEHWGRGETPVFNVSWYDVQHYLRWLSKQTGKRYRLPSEAEWEYAARAGATTPFHTGHCINAAQANFHAGFPYTGCSPGNKQEQRYRGRTIASGTFAPNAWGLHDVHGNIFEWTEDCWHESYNKAPANGSAWVDYEDDDFGETELAKNCRQRVLRGGSWSGRALDLRLGYRAKNAADFKSIFIGFRVVREL